MNPSEILEELLVDAHGDAEQLTALEQGMLDAEVFPCPARVVGEPVVCEGVRFDGNPLRGLVASCRRPNGHIYFIQLADLAISAETPAEPYVAAYRQWMGLPPRHAEPQAPKAKRAKKTPASTAPKEVMSLVVTRAMVRMVRVRDAKGEPFIFRPKNGGLLAAGQQLEVAPTKQWRNQGNDYVSGEIRAVSIAPEKMGISPLRVDDLGRWTPPDFGSDEPLHPDVAALMRKAPLPTLELIRERVYDLDDDPILEAVELRELGEYDRAMLLLEEQVEKDLSFIDAHAHLGNLDFDLLTEKAIAHFEVGMRIAEWSMGEDFDGYLPWGFVGNRPYLRCLHGYGLAQWKLGRFQAASDALSKLLRFNPDDNQGVRYILPDIWMKTPWVDEEAG